MRRSEVIVEAPVTAAGVTVIPVARFCGSAWGNGGSVSVFAARYPVAVVVVCRSVKKAFRATGEEVPLDHLTGEVPGLKDVLARL